jgi:capsular polysaccharide transport system ATP-binding protein
MIILERVTKFEGLGQQKRIVLSAVSISIPSNRRIALLGSSTEDQRVVINLLGGTSLPTSGRIIKKVRVSYPVGYFGGFTPELSVRGNILHIARLYGLSAKSLSNFVERLLDLGDAFEKPFKELSSVQKKLVGRVIAYSIPFDVYVLHDAPDKGKVAPNDLCRSLFEARIEKSGVITAVRKPVQALHYCDMALVLNGGQLQLFDDVKAAIATVETAAKAARSLAVVPSETD